MPRHPRPALPRLLALLLLIGAAGGVRAEVVDWLYRVDVPVPDDAAGERLRRSAARDALAEVLVRVTGLRELGEPAARRRAGLAEAFARPDPYYNRYAFVSVAVAAPPPDPQPEPGDPGGPVLPTPAPAPAPQDSGRRLRFDFSPAAVQELLAANGLPLWPKRRPLLLVWLAAEDDSGRRWLDPTRDPLAAALRDVARQRGLPLVFPAHDLEDDLALSLEDLWFDYRPGVLGASDRYRADLVLVGRLRSGALGNHVLDWQSLDPEVVSLHTAFEGAEPAALGAQALHLLADRLAARFAVLGAAEEGVLWCRISGIDDLARYAAVQAWLRGTDAVEDAQLVRVEEDQLLFRLRVRGSAADLLEVFSLDARVQAQPALLGGAEVLDVTWLGEAG